MSIQSTLRALPIWRGTPQLEPLGGGLTNHNFVVTDGDSKFVARAATDQPALGIDRGNELACSELGHSLGVAPAVTYSQAGITVFEFVEGVAWDPESARDPDRIRRACATLHTVHGAGPRMVGHFRFFCGFQVARTYVDFAMQRGLALPADAAGLLAEVAELRRAIAPYEPTFCHNDLMPGNFIDAGSALWLIDWEYAGIGHPVFDLAGLSSNCEFAESDDRILLEAYFGDRSARWQREFRVFKAIAALRESLWAVVQGSQSNIEFDYDQYRDDNWQKFRAAVGRI